MFKELTRRDFIKTASMAALAMAVPAEVFAAEKTKADIVVYGKIFTSENNQIVEAFAVKDGKFVYVGDKSGAKAFIEKGKTEIMKEDGTVLKKEIRGGEIFMGEDGTPTGYLSEQAGTYTRSFLDNEKLYTVEIARKTLDKVQEQLLSEGYTMYLDGTVETGTGFVEPLYPDGHQGTANWEEEELTEITRKANEKGLTMHIHALGNAGVNRVVNSYVNGGKSDMRNTIVHVFGVIPSDYKRMAENNIYVTSYNQSSSY